MPIGPDRRHIPHACGVYLMRDAGGSILYIGKAKDLSRRVAQYFRGLPPRADAERSRRSRGNPRTPDLKKALLAPLVRSIDYICCASEREALLLERRLIRERQPFFNAMWKDDKSYPYLKITLEEDFPRLTLTRRKVEDGGLYFGPYPQVSVIKSLLRHLWRMRLFPLRPCRWHFSPAKPLDQRVICACLYYHTRQCPAPCAGRISRKDYRRIAQNAALFFSGKHHNLRAAFETQMRESAKRLDYERAAQMRDNLEALNQMGERVRLRAITTGDISAPLEASRSVTDLREALGLAVPPFHVECFDVSHFQGRQAVAAMVHFEGGKPQKDFYRKFRLREASASDDFGAIAEAVRRRYSRLQGEGKALPDLVVIDGGKGQLEAARQELQKLGLRIPVAALAKRLEEVFLPGKSAPILLEKSRPALRLLQHLRDEAHRFGLAYHRLLRKKTLLS